MAKRNSLSIKKYSEKFKATAVKLSHLPGVQVKEVADSLYIHPFMLSKWRKQAREGIIVAKGIELDQDVAAELKELRKLKKENARLKLENEILKKGIEFTSQKRAKSSSTSSTTKKGSR